MSSSFAISLSNLNLNVLPVLRSTVCAVSGLCPTAVPSLLSKHADIVFFCFPSFFFLLRLLSLKLRWGEKEEQVVYKSALRRLFIRDGVFAAVLVSMFPRRLIREKKGINFYVIAGAFKQNDCSLHKVKDSVSEVFFFFSLLFLLDCLSIIGVIDSGVNERWNEVSWGKSEQNDHRSNVDHRDQDSAKKMEQSKCV